MSNENNYMDNNNNLNETTVNFKFFIPKYEQYLINQAKSINTISSYIADINVYFDMYDDINRENIKLYKLYLSKFSVSSINRKLSSLKSFNEYLLMLGLVESLIIIKQDFIKKQGKNNPTDITEKQVSIFLNEVVNNIDIMYKSRNIAIIYLIANTGIRREEVTNLKLKNLDIENKSLIVIGKGNKEREIYLNETAIIVLNNYLKDRNGFRFSDSPYIFVSERSEKIHKCSINGIFKKYNTEGCKVKVHDLRHNYASTVVEQEIMPLSELQNQLGHASLTITGCYVHPRKDKVKNNIDKLKIGNIC